MDEIVFEHRNKEYGAYVLRKLYKKYVTRALLLSVLVMVAAITYPLVNSFYAQKRAKYIEKEAGAEFISMDKPQEEAPPPPPPPPPPAALEQKVKFVAPVITTEEVVEDVDVFNQDELAQSSTNEPVAQVDEYVAAPVEEVIEVQDDKTPPLTFVEEMPTFVGGDDERKKFLAENLVYPTQAAETGIQGTVYVSFIVDTRGNISDVKVVRGIGGGCDEEAIRVVKMMPPWHPGKQNGKTVRVLFNMAIQFKLQTNK